MSLDIFALAGSWPRWFRLPSSVSVVVSVLISKPFQCCLPLYFPIYWDSPFQVYGQKAGALIIPLCLTLPTTVPMSEARSPERERKKWQIHHALSLGPQLLQLKQKIPTLSEFHIPDCLCCRLCGIAGDENREKEKEVENFPPSLWVLGGPLLLSEPELEASPGAPEVHTPHSLPGFRLPLVQPGYLEICLSSPIDLPPLAFHTPKIAIPSILFRFYSCIQGEAGWNVFIPSYLEPELKLVPLNFEKFCHAVTRI